MKGIPKGRYTLEFRQEAVKLVTEEKLSFPEAARRLSLAPSTLCYWVKAFKADKLGEIGKMQKPLTDAGWNDRPHSEQRRKDGWK